MAREGLRLLIEKERRDDQLPSGDYNADLIAKLNTLHREVVRPNPERFPTWQVALEAKGFANNPMAIKYSIEKGWLSAGSEVG